MEEEINYNEMRYTLDNEGYILKVNWGCTTGECTEYTGTIPSGYDSLEDWFNNAEIRAYKIVDGNLVYDENRANELQAAYELETEENTLATHKWVNNRLEKTESVVIDEFGENVSGSSLVILEESGDYEIPETTVSSSSITEVNLVSSNKNLLGINAITETVNGVEITVNADGTIKLNGTSTGAVEFTLNGTSTNEEMLFLIKNGIEYAVSGLVNNTSLSLYSYDGTDRTLIGTYNNGVINLSSSNTVTHIILKIDSGKTFSNTVISPQIEIGEATDFIKHEETKVNLTLESNEATTDALKSYSPYTVLMADQEVNINVSYFRYKTLETKLSSLEISIDGIRSDVKTVEEEITVTQKTTGENNLHIDNVLESDALEYFIEGKSEQETSVQGKNYFTGNKISNGTGLGITYNFDNSIIKLNGTSTASATIMDGFTKITLPAGTYTYYLGLKSGSFTLNGKDLAIYLRSSDAFITGSAATSGNTLGDIKSTGSTKKTFSITEEKDLYIRMFVNGAGLVCEDLELYLQIEQGSSYTGFEQFIPNSPSPDYPSEIKTINGIENLFDKDDVFLNKQWNGNSLVESEVANASPKIPVIGGKKYKRNVGYNANTFIKNDGSYVDIQGATNTIVAPENSKYWMFNIPKEVDLNTVIAVQGDTISDYVPYGRWAKVKIVGKNILNYGSSKSGTTNGITYEYDSETGIWTFNGTATARTEFYFMKYPVSTTANKTYTLTNYYISGSTSADGMVYLQDGNNSWKGYSCPLRNMVCSTQATYNIDLTMTLQLIRFETETVLTNYKIKTQMEEGTATEYEEYKEKEALIDLNKPNLFNKDNAEVGNGLIGNDGNFVSSTTNKCIVNYIPITENTIYTLIYNGLYRVIFYDENKTLIKANANVSSPYIFTTPANTKFIRISGDLNINLDGIKIYEGYTEHYELCSNNNIKDELNIIDGQVVINKKIDKVVLKSSDSSLLENSSTKGLFQITLSNVSIDLSNVRAKSTYFKGINGSSITSSDNSVCTYSGNRIMFTYKEFANNITGLKTWLDENNPEVYYELATPETIELENCNIPLFEGVNHITLVEDVETNTSIKYLRDIPMSREYTTNQELNKAKTELYSTIEQTAGEINLEVGKKVNEEDYTGANILLKINEDESEATINADKVSLKGKNIDLTSDNIEINSTNFKVDKDGNMTCTSGTFGGNINTSNDITIGNNLYVGQNQTGQNLDRKYIYFSDKDYICNSMIGNSQAIALHGEFVSLQGKATANDGLDIDYSNDDTSEQIAAIGTQDRNAYFFTNLYADNIQSGRCTLTSSGDRTIYFNKTFSEVPNVILTPVSTTNGVIAGKISEITTTYFTANIGGTNFGDETFCWIAIL